MSLINVSSDVASNVDDNDDDAYPWNRNSDEWLLWGLSETLNVKAQSIPPDSWSVLGKGCYNTWKIHKYMKKETEEPIISKPKYLLLNLDNYMQTSLPHYSQAYSLIVM